MYCQYSPRIGATTAGMRVHLLTVETCGWHVMMWDGMQSGEYLEYNSKDKQ